MARVQITYPEKTLFTQDVPIRISDINYGKHLGHDTLVSILHEARYGLFRHFGMDEADTDGMGVLLVDLAVSYRAQVFHGQTLRVDVAVADVVSRGCDMVYRVTDRDSGKLVALGRTGILFYDYKNRQVVNIPRSFQAIL